MIHLYHVQTCALRQYLLLGEVEAKNLVLNVGHLGPTEPVVQPATYSGAFALRRRGREVRNSETRSCGVGGRRGYGCYHSSHGQPGVWGTPPKLKKENPGYEHCGGTSNCPTNISVGGGPK